ncbi:hypothetical protein QWY85_16225 [Neolewinella lacunae]|uniref:Uncharacterized protein n=1 Tax=Neolewinella lacunae TaxID=1517758 RepID=A0A923T825_9BACT|nr:hypothetical protein [Neolewinella lacunae]MBC6993508.1 hypothetical protein [Neolewinella lacunae]MDN3636216.1 hypothetical protein [Neolewinella lacunae]
MKSSHHLNALAFTIPLLLLACVKADKAPISAADMWGCHRAVTWDSLSVKEALTGEWKWEYIGCYWNYEDANYDEFAGLTIEFNADSTLEVRENGVLTQTSNWEVVIRDGDLFGIDVDPRVHQLYGRILLCNDRVKFDHSYIDGCDNFFKRR